MFKRKTRFSKVSDLELMGEYSKFVEFSTHFFKFVLGWLARIEKQLDVTTMFTDFHAKTHLSANQSARTILVFFLLLFF